MKEEFETLVKNMGYSITKVDGVYLNINVIILENGYLAGRNSLDEEIKKWKENYIKLYEWIIARDLLREYLEDFHDVLKEIK